MKTKETAKTETKLSAKATSAISAAIVAVLTASDGVASAIATESRKVEDAALTLQKNAPDKETAREALTSAYSNFGAQKLKLAGDALKEFLAKHSANRSRILTIAFPKAENAEATKQALAEKLPTLKLIAAASGSLKKDKRTGQWKQVIKKSKQGGSNRLSPVETLSKALTLAITAAQTAKLDDSQVANQLVPVLEAAGYKALVKALAGF